MSLRMISDVIKNRDIDSHCPLCGRPFSRVKSDEEHIFPKWLQHHHNLWTKRLTIPNFIGKTYNTVKIDICVTCNNRTFGRLETVLSPLLTSSDPFSALRMTPNEDVAIWLGKIFWLLCRKSHSVEDFRTRNQAERDQIIPREIMPGTFYLGMIQRAFATNKGMASCYENDPPYPPLYGPPFSFYRFHIDTRDTRFESFDFCDNVAVLGAAIRSGNIGFICVFDGGLHRQFRSQEFRFLAKESLHPMQFNEVIGKIFYDQTVLDSRACEVTYYWNKVLHSVIAQTHTSRDYNPYLEENHDPKRYAAMLGRHTFSDPNTVVSDDGKHVVTSLKDHRGRFLRYAVTDEEIEAARRDPNQVVRGPLSVVWRQKPPIESGD